MYSTDIGSLGPVMPLMMSNDGLVTACSVLLGDLVLHDPTLPGHFCTPPRILCCAFLALRRGCSRWNIEGVTDAEHADPPVDEQASSARMTVYR